MPSENARGILAAIVIFAFAAGGARALDSDPVWEPPEQVTYSGATNRYQHLGSDRILAFDHHGFPAVGVHLSGSANRPACFRRVPGFGWSEDYADASGSEGAYPSLAFDRYERPAISYVDGGSDQVKYAAWDGAAWNAAVVDTGVNSGYGCTALAMDLYGRPAIAYVATGGVVKFVMDTDGDGDWSDETKQTVSETTSNRWPSLAFDPLNRPMIAFHNDSVDNLCFAVKDNVQSVWRVKTVDAAGTTGWYPSLAIDPDNGYPAISYQDASASALNYAWWDGEAWQIDEGVATWGESSSLAFDPADGRPAIAFAAGGDLRFAWHDGSNWHLQTVSTAVSYYPSLAFNEYGTGWPAIAFLDQQNTVYYTEDPPDVPEPATLSFLLIGAAALLRLRRRRKAARRTG